MNIRTAIFLAMAGATMFLSGCEDRIVTAVKPDASMSQMKSDADACGAYPAPVGKGVYLDDLKTPEFAACMRERGYDFVAS